MMRSYPLLRSTRRGWFLEANDGSDSGSGAAAGEGTAAPGETKPPGEEAAANPLDYKALLLAILSLPAEASDEEISAKEEEIRGTLGGMGELQTKAGSADELQRQLDEISSKYDELNRQQTELFKQKQEADADEILNVYAGCFTNDEAKASIRNILLTDKDAGIAILNGLKKPDATAEAETTTTEPKKESTPPEPKHDPGAGAGTVSEEEIAKKVSARAAELRREFPKKSQSDLFAQAEKEVRAKLSTAASA